MLTRKQMTTAAFAAALTLVTAQSHAQGGNAAAGAEKAKACVACHGEGGNSTQPNFPRLAGQYADYIAKALEDYKTGARQNPVMAGFAGALTTQDRRDLGAYFASQKDGLHTIEYTK